MDEISNAASVPTARRLRAAATVIEQWAESRRDSTAQEVVMARYTADNMRVTAQARLRAEWRDQKNDWRKRTGKH